MALDLSESQAARVRQVYMLSGIRQGLSGNAIIDSLRALGLGQRTQTMQQQIASLVGRPGPLPSLDAETLQALYNETPQANFTSRSSNNFVYTFKFAPGTEVSGDYVPDVWSIVSPFALPPQLAQVQALEILKLDDESQSSLTPEDIVSLKPRKFTPFQP